MELSSSTFTPWGEIPRRHTCEGEDIAPPLQWRGVAEGAASLVLIVDDPDAPDPAAPRMTWVRWVLYDIPPSAPGLPDGGRRLPAGTREGLNDRGRHGYGAPCPLVGRHRCFFKRHALDKLLPALPRPTQAAVEQAMCGYVLAQAELIGTYRKRRR